ncbi:MAG TPA: cytochrome P450 [Ktedonobacteraceae bacterium]|nr:cytochrome P450 [Ktedonobacteraceae bacterium]
MSRSATTTPGTPSVPGAKKRPPGPRSLSPFSAAAALRRDPIRFALNLQHRYGDVVHFRFLFWPAYVYYHPDHVKRVLQENHRNYNKNFPNMKAAREVFGNGLFTNDGESWLHQRRLMQPSFHHKRLEGFGALMTNSTLAMLERWERINQNDTPLDISVEMTRLTLRVAGQALFSLDLANEVDTVGRTFANILPLINSYTNLPFPPLWVPTPRNHHLLAGLKTLDNIVYSMINERRKQPVDPDAPDLLWMLLSARDEETGEGMSDQQLRDEVLTLLLGGYETTAATLSWSWYLLSQYSEVEERLHAELDTVLAGRPPTVKDLDVLPYNRMVIQEAMRLYPPAFGFTRFAIGPDEVGGYTIPANSVIFLSDYCTHRHPAFWEKPEVFDPERFTPERSASRPRFAYFPFGGGPRQCIGNAFAMMEAQLVLATVAQRITLRLVPGHSVEPQVQLTMRPRYGLPMTLQPRFRDV